MTRIFYWLGVFVLGAVVAHLSFVLFMPRHEARALQAELLRDLGGNSFHVLQGTLLRRLVRHPLPDASYGVCVLDLDSDRGVSLQGPDLRTLWALTIYSPRGDVIYAITDRHVPQGMLNVRFKYHSAAGGKVALPRLRGKALVVPLTVSRAILVMEAYPWHPGQVKLVRQLLEQMRCTSSPLENKPPADAAVPTSETPPATTPRPRSRPLRATP